MNVTIDNQCPNTELTSPAYFIKDTTRHMHFPQSVNSESKMEANFKTGMDGDTFGGTLLYHLQWKEDASISTKLLVIWGWNSYGLYSHAWLIEHESALTWNEDKLKRLYDVYNSQCNIDFDEREWFLDGNKKLRTKCETSRGGLEMNIAISEETNLLSYRKPVWVDSNR
jgi:hypothetical protein